MGTDWEVTVSSHGFPSDRTAATSTTESDQLEPLVQRSNGLVELSLAEFQRVINTTGPSICLECIQNLLDIRCSLEESARA